MREGLSGSQIGKYAIERVLGEGGMGTVYLGRHVVLEHEVAIKVLRHDLTAKPVLIQRFFLEAKAVAKLRDPGLAQLHDYGHAEDGRAYFVMEYLDGETLFQRVKQRGALPEVEVLRIAAQVAGTLATVHRHGVVHRDLKPENIFIVRDALVDGGERIKVLDFGVAKLASEDVGLTRVAEMLGTPLYMAPEQWQGAALVDARADIYSLGCIIYCCLCGRPPFVGRTIGTICAGHLVEEPKPPIQLKPNISAAVNALVMQCLEKAPGERPPTMAALAAQLRALQAALQRPSAASSIRPSPTIRLPPRPNVARKTIDGKALATRKQAPSGADQRGGTKRSDFHPVRSTMVLKGVEDELSEVVEAGAIQPAAQEAAAEAPASAQPVSVARPDHDEIGVETMPLSRSDFATSLAPRVRERLQSFSGHWHNPTSTPSGELETSQEAASGAAAVPQSRQRIGSLVESDMRPSISHGALPTVGRMAGGQGSIHGMPAGEKTPYSISLGRPPPQTFSGLGSKLSTYRYGLMAFGATSLLIIAVAIISMISRSGSLVVDEAEADGDGEVGEALMIPGVASAARQADLALRKVSAVEALRGIVAAEDSAAEDSARDAAGAAPVASASPSATSSAQPDKIRTPPAKSKRASVLSLDARQMEMKKRLKRRLYWKAKAGRASERDLGLLKGLCVELHDRECRNFAAKRLKKLRQLTGKN